MARKKIVAGLLLLGVVAAIRLLYPLVTPTLPERATPLPSSPASYPWPPTRAMAESYPGLRPRTAAPAKTKRPSQPTHTPVCPPLAEQPFVVPATATPGATATPPQTIPIRNFKPGPTLQVPPERQQALVAALEQVPEIAPLLQPEEQVKRLEVQTLQLLPLDVDADGLEETFWVYLIRRFYGGEKSEQIIYGHLGQALFDDDNRLLWYASPEDVFRDGWVATLRVQAEPVRFSATDMGVFYHRYRIFDGHGGHRGQRSTLYRWDGTGLQPIWQRETAGGGKQGAGDSGWRWDFLAFEDVDGAGWPELLLEHVEGVLNSSLRQDYSLYLPGQLAWRWDGESYVPGYFVNGEEATPLRPRLPLHYAPRLSVPPTIDGCVQDWWQIEYLRSLYLRPQQGLSYLRFHVAWDEDYLYVFWSEQGRGQTTWLALDTDLAGDLDEQVLDGDDWVWAVTLSDSRPCTVTVQVQGPRPPEMLDGNYRLAVAPGDYYSSCAIEMALPLELLGLDGEKLVSEPGWVAAGEDLRDREYHPAAGRVIGFAASGEVWQEEAPYVWDDPTTWVNLVFMADR